MPVTSVGTAATTSSETISLGENQITGQDFLELLVAQLTHQDPLDPMDGTEFVSQLAELQSVSALGDISSYLEGSNISELYSSLQDWQGFMGPVATIGHTVHWTDSTGVAASGEVDAVVRDSSGVLMLVVGEQEIAFSDIERIE